MSSYEIPLDAESGVALYFWEKAAMRSRRHEPSHSLHPCQGDRVRAGRVECPGTCADAWWASAVPGIVVVVAELISITHLIFIDTFTPPPEIMGPPALGRDGRGADQPWLLPISEQQQNRNRNWRWVDLKLDLGIKTPPEYRRIGKHETHTHCVIEAWRFRDNLIFLEIQR